jgi:hypothetical protein
MRFARRRRPLLLLLQSLSITLRFSQHLLQPQPLLHLTLLSLRVLMFATSSPTTHLGIPTLYLPRLLSMVARTLSHIVIALTPSIKIYRVLVALLLMVEPMADLVALMSSFYPKPSSLLMLLVLQTILYRKSLSVLLLASFRHNMVPSLVFSINMLTMALVRLSILSPSCVILAPSSTTLLVRLVVNSV